MAKFVVAFRDRDTAEKIASLLRDSGYEVIKVCTDGDDVKRTFHRIHDGILISGYRLKDRLLPRVAEDLDDHAEVLALVRADDTDLSGTSGIFVQKLPVSRSELAQWADMLSQLHDHKMPRRDKESQETVSLAKQKLMEERGMTEREAHRYLQRTSMRLGLRMEQTADRILSHGTV
ncbi:MAG: ANTAR domain-containing protein [Solobacterium sp.]|nr:ANTAR domain-containing protein [Solobacterium sp.]